MLVDEDTDGALGPAPILLLVTEGLLVDEDGTGTITTPPDIDGDGIANEIDGRFVGGAFVDEHVVPSVSFTDQHLGGTTFGAITGSSGLPVVISDIPNEKGVFIEALSGPGQTVVTSCVSPGGDVVFEQGKTANVKCGSIEVEVLIGPVEVVVGPVSVSVPSGATAEITEDPPGQLSIENVSGPSTPSIVITQGADVTELAPGETHSTEIPVAGPEQVNAFLELVILDTAYDSTPAPGAPGGLFSMTATFRNTSERTLRDVFFDISVLNDDGFNAPNPLVLNADGGPEGVGGTVSLAASALGSDGVLSPGEEFTVVFVIGLQAPEDFVFLVDANATVVAP